MASSSTPRLRTYTASGTINPNSFVKYDSSSNGKNPTVIQCGAGDRPIGIAQVDGTTAVSSGSSVEVALPGGGAKLQCSASVALGNFIKSDSSGYGVPTANAGDAYGAQAVEAASSNDIIGAEVMIGEKYNASA